MNENSHNYGIMEEVNLEVCMTLIKQYFTFKNIMIFAVLACMFTPHNAFVIMIGYKLINKALDNEVLNRIGFGIFCTICLMTIGWFIQKG